MKKVLIIDDDLQNRKILRKALERDYCLEEAVNGKEGAMKFFCFKPDVILLDLMMPVMNGRETLKMIREQEASDGVPLGKGAATIIIVSASTDGWRQLFNDGADSVLHKPLNVELLHKKIEEALLSR